MNITSRYYNRILGGGSLGFKWSADDGIVMFELYREPFSVPFESDESCFFAVDIQNTRVVTADYSETFRGINAHDPSTIWLEHGGLNDIYDYYLPGTNCYVPSVRSECTASSISPTGEWELSQFDDSNITLNSSSGQGWRYSYPPGNDVYDHPVTFVQRWSDDESYVLFSPAGWYSTARVYGLFEMDLSSGRVDKLLGNDALSQPYYLSVSPGSRTAVYLLPSGQGKLLQLPEKTEHSVNVQLAANDVLSNFVWSPDEDFVVFSRNKLDSQGNVTSVDYLRLDVRSREIVGLLEGAPEYHSITAISDSDVVIGGQTFTLQVK